MMIALNLRPSPVSSFSPYQVSPPPQSLCLGKRALSRMSKRDDQPGSDLTRLSAVESPAGPAPATMTSKKGGAGLESLEVARASLAAFNGHRSKATDSWTKELGRIQKWLQRDEKNRAAG